MEKFIVGRGITGDEGRQRVRLLPLPSIGTAFTDPSIRRILIELPPDCPIPAGDIRWALSGQALRSLGPIRLIEAGSNAMPYQYGIGRSARRWQTVTPAVLPTTRAKGRNGAQARLKGERSAAIDVVQALRHAGIRAHPTDIRVQREPFVQRGLPADSFEADRFERERLYHVDVSFDEEISGVLAIGDGRWLGLGLMRPLQNAQSQVSHDADAGPLDDGDEEEVTE